MILFLGSTYATYDSAGLELDNAAHSTPPRHTPVQTHPTQQAAGLMASEMLGNPPYPSFWETQNQVSFLSYQSMPPSLSFTMPAAFPLSASYSLACSPN